jgi:urease accessory protein
MFDAAPTPGPHQRARGAAAVVFGPGGRLCDLSQAGSAKAMLPDTYGRPPEVVFLNTAGGLTGGDRLAYALTVGAGARVTGTTQTAERAYRAIAGAAAARMDVDLTVGAGARLDWVPQETILFDGAALDRRTRVNLDPGATILLAEMLVFGRAAMGEAVARLSFRDAREVRCGGRPIWIDRVAIDGADLGAGRPALIDGARAVATVALVGPGAEDAAGPLRAALGDAGQVSAWDGKCVTRMAAPAALPLRRAVMRAVAALRPGMARPRVWQDEGAG